MPAWAGCRHSYKLIALNQKIMKYTNKILLGALAVGALSGCTDDSMLPYDVGAKPESLSQYEYLNNYDVLKSYVDRTENPNFKLGIALAATDYINGDQVYSLACSNFDEMTAGNEMKYASIVSDDGTMNFSTVTSFIDAARQAGMTIYGHTLAWHSQQNLNYLNSLIAPTVIPGTAGNGGYCLILKNATAGTNIWDAQTWYQLSTPLQSGTTYTLSFMARASEAYNDAQIYMQCSDGGNQEYPGGFSVGPEWQQCTLSLTPTGATVDKIAFNFGTAAIEIYIDDISLTASGSTESLIPNGDFESGSITGWTGWTPGNFETISEDGEGYSTSGGGPTYDESVITSSDFESGIGSWGGWGGSATRGQSAQGNGYESDYSFEIDNPTVSTNEWDIQVAWDFASPLVEGGTYRLNMMIKGSVEGSIGAALQRKSDYAGAGDFPAISISTEWEEYTAEITVGGDGADCADRFLFNIGNYAGTINIDNITLCYLNPEGGGGGQTIEMTPEEKKDTLTWAMDNWIKGMMEACGGYVVAWDVANETVSGADSDGDGYYDLQSATNGDPSTNFYWADYLGSEDYLPIVTKAAEKYFAEYGGNAADLKLFVNDFNLESWWDGNQKLKSLIHWIEVWEANGAKIDGIGTQMHVSYILNEADQKAQEDAIVNMFELMAATGKLIKISELDMGIVEKAFGEGIKTENVTFDQQLKMAEFYQFIIDKYFEIIPAAQRYGITQWCITDSPAESGWRGGEPVGLWDLNYNRKPTYGGFANGLAGEVIVPAPAAE